MSETAAGKSHDAKTQLRPSRAKGAMQSKVVSNLELLDVHDWVVLTKTNEKTVHKMEASGEIPKSFPLRPGFERSPKRWTKQQYERWAQRRQKESEQQVA